MLELAPLAGPATDAGRRVELVGDCMLRRLGRKARRASKFLRWPKFDATETVNAAIVADLTPAAVVKHGAWCAYWWNWYVLKPEPTKCAGTWMRWQSRD